MISRNRERFPIWVHAELDDLKLDPFTMRVYVHLARRANGSGKAWPSRESIAEHCGMSEKQVTRCVQVLEDEGLIVVLRNAGQDGGRRNTYWLVSTDDWLAKAVAKAKKSAGGEDSQSPPLGGVGTDVPQGGDSQSPSHTKEGKPEEGKPIKEQAPVSVPVPPPGKRAGKKEAKHADPKSFLVHAPAEWRADDDFVHAWNEWGQNRIENKNPLTERGAKGALGKLTKHPLPVAIEALVKATMSNWTGVFPESIATGGKSGKFAGASEAQPPLDLGNW